MNKLLLSTPALALAVACSGGDGDNGNGNGNGGADGGPSGADAAAAIEFDETGLLENVASNVIVPLYEDFESATNELASAVDAYCEALGTGDAEASLAAARAAFHDAMDLWQRAEVTSIGPASRDGDALRDLIYSWPSVSACATDRAMIQHHDDPSSFAIVEQLPNRRGLDVLEYLLFNDVEDSACSTPPDGWDELSTEELAEARCAYAAIAAADLDNTAGVLASTWHPNGANFAGDLAAAGEPGSSFASTREAVNAVFAGLFYVETLTKDEKLAKPAGLLDNLCGTEGEPCPDELEDRFADRGAANIEANVAGFEDLFFGIGADGEDGLGFDDYLAAAGKDELADDIRDGIGGTLDALATLPGELRESLTDSYQAVVDIHTRVRDVTTPLKTTVPDTLDLQIPTEAGGDTD